MPKEELPKSMKEVAEIMTQELPTIAVVLALNFSKSSVILTRKL